MIEDLLSVSLDGTFLARIMTIAGLFDTWIGTYIAQSFLHALVAALIVDTALIAWRIENPLLRQRLRLLVIVLPILSFPLYQALSPERGSILFRLGSFFDIRHWLNLTAGGPFSGAMLFLVLILFSSAIFLVQELLPILRHAAAEKDVGSDARPLEPDSPLAVVIGQLPGSKPGMYLFTDDEPVIFSTTGRVPAVYFSSGLVRILTESELCASVAHEIAHIERSRRPLMVFVFLLRVLQFYNPIILMEFRRIAQEEEKICDEMAIARGCDRDSMASAIEKIALHGTGEDGASGPQALADRLEEYGHAVQIEGRLAWLATAPAPEPFWPFVYLCVLATAVYVNYYLV